LDDLTKYATSADFYTMTMAVLMNKRKWDSLPDDVKNVMADNSGLPMSLACGKAYDDTDEPFKKRALSKGIQVIEFPPAEKKKLEDLTIPLRNEWIKDMESRGLPGKAVLDTALHLLEKR
jgi:TRAP-type C4-dicarboxylate transport system substrate-binding protein